LILASTASFQAVPYISTYAATKAFIFFLRRLCREMKPPRIRVCATLSPVLLNPNSTPSAGQDQFNRDRESAGKVASTGLDALAAGKSYVTLAGATTRTQGERLVPRRLSPA